MDGHWHGWIRSHHGAWMEDGSGYRRSAEVRTGGIGGGRRTGGGGGTARHRLSDTEERTHEAEEDGDG